MSPSVLEIAYGLAKAAPVRPLPETALASSDPVLTWFTRLATSDLVVTLALDATAALVAGRVRAAHPTPPTNGRRRGSKAEGRAGWVLDIEIAACAWGHGHALATDNRRDFEAIRDVIAALYPGVPALEVLEAPSL